MNGQGDIVVTEEGTSDMFLSFVPRLSVVYAPIEIVQFELIGELGWAPKIVVVQNGDSDVFHYTRATTGLNVNIHIPFKNYRRSFFLGAGGSVNRMKFEDYHGVAPGVRGQMGVRMYTRKLVIDIFGAFMYTVADSNSVAGTSIELNYSTLLLGANLYGKLHEK